METKKYPALRTRLAIVLIILAAVFSAGVSSVLYANFRTELHNSLRHRLENITTLAGLQQNGDLLLQVQSENDESFLKIREQNLKIRRSDPELRFVYTMRKDKQGIYFVVDAGLPGEQGYSPFGMRYEEPGPTLAENFDSMTGTLLEPEFYTDEYGTFLSGYTPIFSSDGKRVGVLGVDITADTIMAQEQKYLFRLISIFTVTLFLIVPAGIIAANYLAKPIVGLRDAAEKISKGDFTYRITAIPGTRELAELASDFNTMTVNLSDLINDLENRVTERTADLEKKTDQLRAASFIARQTAEVHDLASLLDIVVRLVSDRFGFYHTGIYLINEAGDEAILQAASSEGGLRMIENGHSISIGSLGVVGYALVHKKPRIIFDIGTDAVVFNNPDLPMTRSEVVLPLVIRNKALGVLNIHSDKPQAFNAEDIDLLQTLADQVAVAIENARLLDESQAAVTQLEALTTERTREAWSQELKRKGRAFTYTPLGLRADKVSLKDEKAINTAITLRGNKIGNISISRKEETAWSKMDEDLIAEVANQIGLAIDNIRLLEDATQRAEQEQMVGKLAAHLGRSLDIDSLLQTAARELGQLPEVEEATVFISEIAIEGQAQDNPADKNQDQLEKLP
jgi:GAF domain-containing protein/HAMP domain-containing protein